MMCCRSERRSAVDMLRLLAFIATLPLAGSLVAQPPEVWLDSRVSKLPTGRLGPFVRIADDMVLGIDGLATFVSDDGGRTWSDPRPLIGALEENIKVSNERAMIVTDEGTIIAAFMNLNEREWTWSNEIHDAPGAKLPTWVMRSDDEGKTWNHVQKLHDEWTGAVRDMIQTKDGRIIFTAMKFQHDPGRHAVLTYSSTDDGKTWKASNLIDLGGQGHHGGVTEPTLTELPDGRLWMLIRTNWGEFWSAMSYDGGRFWRVIQPSGIASSSAPGLLKRLQSGRLLLVWNRPFPEGKSEWKLSGGDGLWSETQVSNFREELSLAISDNDGESWSDPVVIARSQHPAESKQNHWIAYPYIFEYKPGELWLTTMQGDVRIRLNERDFVASIIAFGDSTTATRGELEVYPKIVAEELQASGRASRVINAGVGGNDTEQARARFEQDVLVQQPSTVVIQFGINDAAVDVWKKPAATESRVSVERYEENLRYFVEMLKARGARVILMTPNPIRWTPELLEMYGKAPYVPEDPDGFNVRLREYAEAVRQIANTENVALIDADAIFREYGKQAGQSVDELLLDGMHPNALGHRLIADQLLVKLREATK